MDRKILDMIKHLKVETFPNNTVLWKDGEAPTDLMYFVFQGEVGIFKLRDGADIEINKVGPGDFFGEMALVFERPRLATARVTSEQARLIVITRKTLMQMAGNSPGFLFHLLRYAVERLLAAEDKLQRVREEVQVEKMTRGLK